VGGIPGVWLGQIVDYSPSAELDGNPSVDATGDNVANTNDEDGVTVPGRWSEGPTGGQFNVQVNTSSGTCAGCRLGFWIDWNQDGDFGDDSESYLVPVVAGPNAVTFNVPAGAFPVDPLYVRFRLYSPEYIGPIEPNGLAVNGEIEDYVFRFDPNALSLSGFAAAPVATTWPRSAAWLRLWCWQQPASRTRRG
jgi:hypothetical protein